MKHMVELVKDYALRNSCLWERGVVVSHSLCMRKAPGSNPGVSTIFLNFLLLLENYVLRLVPLIGSICVMLLHVTSWNFDELGS